MNKWTRVKFQPNLPLKESGRVTASKEHILLSKEAAKEGMVLLKNCLLYTSPSPRDVEESRMPSSA